jgi:hypothetical protein
VERDEFEEYCLLHPEVAEQVATDRALLRGMRNLPSPSARRPAPQWARLALAAGVVGAAVALGTWSYFGFGASGPIGLYATTSALPAASRARVSEPLTLALVRGGGSLTTLRIQPADKALQLEFDPGVTSATEFEFTLVEHTDAGDTERGRIRQRVILEGDERIVPLVIDLANVRAPKMRLDVSIDGTTQSYELRVERQ